MWWIVNIVLLAASAGLIAKGWHVGQKSETYRAYRWLIAGAAVFIVGLASSFIKWVWF